MRKVSEEKLEKYFSYTRKAINNASSTINEEEGEELISKAERYFDDAEHFREEDDYVNSLAALSYAYGLLDSGASLDFFDVDHEELFK